MAKPKFDPSKPFEVVGKPKFDPSQPFEEVASGEQEDDSPITARGLLKGTLEALPMAGAVAGGFLGTAGGPIGTVAGAGGGGYLGKAAQNLGEKYLLGEDKTREQIYLDPLKEAALSAAGEGAGQVLGKGLSKVGNIAGGAIKKGASSMSRIPEKVMETYANRTKDVEKLINQYGSDIAQSSDEFKGLINKQIGAFKSKQNQIIEKALQDKIDVVDISPIKEQLSKTLEKLDSKLEPEQFKKIKEKLDLLNEISPGDITELNQLNKIKQNLQDAADYDSLGNVLQKKTVAEVNLAKSASKARGLLNKAVPEIAEANNSLAKLHRVQKNMNKNLIKEGASEASVIGAGTGENQRNVNLLRKLQETVGGDLVSGAEDIAAQKTFANPGLLPSMNTGAVALPLIGATVGGIKDGTVGGALEGAAIGSLGSPYVIKQAIKYGIPLTKKVSPELIKALSKGASQATIRGLLNNE